VLIIATDTQMRDKVPFTHVKRCWLRVSVTAAVVKVVLQRVEQEKGALQMLGKWAGAESISSWRGVSDAASLVEVRLGLVGLIFCFTQRSDPFQTHAAVRTALLLSFPPLTM
jgi:hypothetical protein